jgi:hypothetical protein
MTHPAFDIIDAINDMEYTFHLGFEELRGRFKDQVWNMPVWIAGTEIHGETGPHWQTHTKAGPDGTPPILPMYLSEAEASVLEGVGQYIATRFSKVVSGAELQRFQVAMIEGEDFLWIAHAALMTLRDLVTMGEASTPNAVEMGLLVSGSNVFKQQAIAYCARHESIHSMRMALLRVPGNKLIAATALNADDFDQHAEALEAIANDIFLPGWRTLFVDASAQDDILIERMNAELPMYDKASSKGWWNKFKKQFGDAPAIAQIPIEL